VSINKYKVSSDEKFKLSKYETTLGKVPVFPKESWLDVLEENRERIKALHSKLYADSRAGLLVLFQGMDGGGKDSAIKHVIGVNPQGVIVSSFKQPSKEELAHDYLWRYAKALPERGTMGIFNRSYYEDVLVVRVHELYKNLNILDRCKGDDTISKRYKHIRDFEEYLWDNAIVTVKIFLNLSKDEQRKRFIKRIDREDRNWKFSDSDLRERGFWNAYRDAFEQAIAQTSSAHNPWWVVPADDKKYARAVISQIIMEQLQAINPVYPVVSDEQKRLLQESRKALMDCKV